MAQSQLGCAESDPWERTGIFWL